MNISIYCFSYDFVMCTVEKKTHSRRIYSVDKYGGFCLFYTLWINTGFFVCLGILFILVLWVWFDVFVWMFYNNVPWNECPGSIVRMGEQSFWV